MNRLAVAPAVAATAGAMKVCPIAVLEKSADSDLSAKP